MKRGLNSVFAQRETEKGKVLRQTADNICVASGVEAVGDARHRSEPAEKNGCILCAASLDVGVVGLFDTRFGMPGSYEIHRCVRCGFEQTFPVLALADLKKLYEAHYNFGGETDTFYTRCRERFLFSFLYRFWTQLDGDISFHMPRGSGRLLDIGCNEGRGLRIYARNGFQAEGLELNEIAAAVARKAGFDVHTCLLEEFDHATPYDFAVLSNVLE